MKVRTILAVLVLVTGLTGTVAVVPAPVRAATAVTISHSSSMDVVTGNSAACTADSGETTPPNSYYRVFDLADFGIANEFTVTSVAFGIETLQPDAVAITVNLYTLDGAFVLANLTPIGSNTETLQPTELSVHSMAVTGLAPAGSTLVVEVAAPDLTGLGLFFIGSNAEGQTGPSYIRSPDCGITQPTNVANIFPPFPNMHIAMQVSGEVGLDVSDVEVAPTPSDEGQAVSASAAFTPESIASPVCTVDYGDGTGPQAATVEDGVCMGPAHIYTDDQPGGYQVTVEVCDGENCGSNSAQHTVNNLAPIISSITTDGPASPGGPVTVTVSATDAGVNDVLMYSFDCNDDGSYEHESQTENIAVCNFDPAAATATVVVVVEDGDGGSDTLTAQVSQSITVCVNSATRALRSPLASGACPPGASLMSLPGANPTTICISQFTGGITWSTTGACSPHTRPHVVPDRGPLSYCQGIWTGQLRFASSGQCQTHETPGVIPGDASNPPGRQ